MGTSPDNRRCALCGQSPDTTVTAVFEWEWYLMHERELDLPIDGVDIPVCMPCLPRPASLQEAFLELETYTEVERDSIYEDAYAMLDELDRAQLTDQSERRPPAD